MKDSGKYYVRALIAGQWENIAIPFKTDELGHQYIVDQIVEMIPEIKDFIERFPDCFTRNENRGLYFFDPTKGK